MLFIILIVPICNRTYSQAILFRNDGTSIKVEDVDTTGKVRYYTIAGQTPGTFQMISIDFLDSIRYADGTVQKFITNDNPISIKDKNPKNNFIGIKLFPILDAKLNIFYERTISKENFGIRAFLLYNAGNKDWFFATINETANYYFGAGLNYYFLNTDISRFGTGLSFFTGQFCEKQFEGMDERLSFKHNNGIIVNLSSSFIVNEQIFFSLLTNYVLKVPPNEKIFIQLELSYNF